MLFTRAFSSLGCPELSLAEVVALAKRHGVEGVELRALRGSLDLPAILAREFGSPENLADSLRAEPVRVVALDASLRLAGGTDVERADLLRCVPWAEAIGVRRLRVFDGGETAGADEIEEMRATMEWWRRARRESGWRVELMVETHDSLFTAEKVARFLRAVPDAAILWDTHHTWKRGGEDPLVTWDAVRDSVVHVHVKDSISRPSAQHPFTYVLPGQGEFPAPGLWRRLNDEFSGVVSLEWERQWHPYLAPLDEALAAARDAGWFFGDVTGTKL